jgi:hypothetical protein
VGGWSSEKRRDGVRKTADIVFVLVLKGAMDRKNSCKCHFFYRGYLSGGHSQDRGREKI